MPRCLYSLLFLLLAGCDAINPPKYSDDKAALLDIVKLDLPIESVRWEIVGTPEETGPVPGPTDYYSLIAEIAPANSVTDAGAVAAEPVWIPPEAARPWLSQAFQSLFAQHRNARVQVSSLPNCRPLQAEVRRSGRRVHGLLCNNAAKSVVYLMLSDSNE